MTPSQKNEKALAALQKMSNFIRTWGDCLYDVQMSMEDFKSDCGLFEARQAIAALSEPDTVGGGVVTVDLIEGSLYLNSTDDCADGKWIEAKDYRKVAQAIHALLKGQRS